MNICALQETKKKRKGQIKYNEVLVIYSGIKKQMKAKDGVAIAQSKKCQGNIQ